MLILTRKPGESIYIGDIKVTIVEMKGNQIRVGIDAPPEVRIYREEIYLQIMEENKIAAEASQAHISAGLPGEAPRPVAFGKVSPLKGSSRSGDASGGEEKKRKPGFALPDAPTSERGDPSSKGNAQGPSGDRPAVFVKRKKKE